MSLKIEEKANVDSEPCVLAWHNKLFVGTEDGSVKIFDNQLTHGKSWAAHSVQLFAIESADGKVYTSSNDAGVRVWSEDGEKITEYPSTGGDIGVLRVFGKEVYAGDETGNVTIFENNQLKAKYNLLEEVKDLWLKQPFLFTVRDLDVTVTEINPDESKSRFTTRHTMEGRAPLRIVGNSLLVMARGGNTLHLHEASIDNKFKKLHEVKVSDMIVTSLSGSGDYVWTGGWDGIIRRWKIVNGKLESAGNITIGKCVNALVVSAPGNAYAALTGGEIVRISAA